MNFSELKYLILDVDGTLTDGGIYYDKNGNEIKKFNTKDAAGLFAVKKLGIKVIVITGRESKATQRRLEELQIDYIYQNIKNKKDFIKQFIQENNILQKELGYIGDDLNDYSSMKLAGFVGCPNDACKEVKKISNCISNLNGGQGAVRDIIEQMLEKENKWENIIKDVYNIGI